MSPSAEELQRGPLDNQPPGIPSSWTRSSGVVPLKRGCANNKDILRTRVRVGRAAAEEDLSKVRKTVTMANIQLAEMQILQEGMGKDEQRPGYVRVNET